MVTIRCTARLLKELGTKPAMTPVNPPGLLDWHANLLRMDRKKCVLFTNSLTLYSFLICCLKKPLLERFDEVFRLGLLKSLMSEGLDDRQVRRMLEGQGTVVIAKTNSRRVLGSMNDLAFQIECMAYEAGGMANADLSRINRELNRIPMSAIKYNFAIEELKCKLSE